MFSSILRGGGMQFEMSQIRVLQWQVVGTEMVKLDVDLSLPRRIMRSIVSLISYSLLVVNLINLCRMSCQLRAPSMTNIQLCAREIIDLAIISLNFLARCGSSDWMFTWWTIIALISLSHRRVICNPKWCHNRARPKGKKMTIYNFHLGVNAVQKKHSNLTLLLMFGFLWENILEKTNSERKNSDILKLWLKEWTKRKTPRENLKKVLKKKKLQKKKKRANSITFST